MVQEHYLSKCEYSIDELFTRGRGVDCSEATASRLRNPVTAECNNWVVTHVDDIDMFTNTNVMPEFFFLSYTENKESYILID